MYVKHLEKEKEGNHLLQLLLFFFQPPPTPNTWLYRGSDWPGRK